MKVFSKISNKIVNSIRLWLGINDELVLVMDKIKDNKKKIEINRETLKNVVEVSTDVIPPQYNNGHSWAVISIGGKCQYVKFVDLDRRNMMEIAKFLKQFEAGRHVVDAPYREIFEDELFYFKKDSE